MAEALLRRDLVARGLDSEVSSAGLMPSGSPPIDEVVEVMREDFALDVSEHRSRRLTSLLIDSVDLVLCMERRHVREVLLLERSAFSRTFTVREFLRRAGAAPRDANLSFDQWIRLLSAGRTTQSLLTMPEGDDILDPMGRPKDAFHDSAREIAAAMSQVADFIATLEG